MDAPGPGACEAAVLGVLLPRLHSTPHQPPRSPLAGVLPPSGGDALVYGESLSTPGGMDRIRWVLLRWRRGEWPRAGRSVGAWHAQVANVYGAGGRPCNSALLLVAAGLPARPAAR